MHGRSHSLGIADSVTVLAQSAAIADAAATLIANAVDIPGSPAVIRKPANELTPDSDLGDRLVTVDLKEIRQGQIEEAVNRGFTGANKYQKHLQSCLHPMDFDCLLYTSPSPRDRG